MSDEFTLSYPHDAVALIQQNVKNVSSEGFQLKRMLLDAVKNNEQAKVLVITGTGKFYSRGADKQGMLDVISQKTTFNTTAAYGGAHNLYFDFPLPIITAMQGHAFGAGFNEGFYGEILILSEISVYAASFMKHGFTPGVGSTFLLPYYLGHALGWEMLFTANDYTGKDLRNRGVTVQVVKQDIVLSTAMKMALELAKMPKLSLQLLKKSRVLRIKEGIMKAIELELSMHEETMGTPAALKGVMELFENLNEQ